MALEDYEAHTATVATRMTTRAATGSYVDCNVSASGVVLGDRERLENTTNTENEGIDF